MGKSVLPCCLCELRVVLYVHLTLYSPFGNVRMIMLALELMGKLYKVKLGSSELVAL